MRKYHNEGVSIDTQFTKNIKVNSAAVHRCHNEVKGSKRHVILYSKLVKSLKIYLNYNRCILLAIRYPQYLDLCPLTLFTTSVSLSPCPHFALILLYTLLNHCDPFTRFESSEDINPDWLFI
jgi:hypothetical protein